MRYVLNMDDPAMGEVVRHELIFDLLFSKKMGFFYQSSYLALTILSSIIVISYKGLWKEWKSSAFLYLSVSILSMSLVLATAPNDGGHLSARYLFGVYPFLFVLGLVLFESFLNSKRTATYWAFVFVISVSVLFSFRQWIHSVQFIRKADKDVGFMVDFFRSTKKQYLVFTDSHFPKNLQSLTYEKTILIVPKSRLITDFLPTENLKIDPSQVLIVRLTSTDLPIDEKGCIVSFRYCKIPTPIPFIEAYTYILP